MHVLVADDDVTSSVIVDEILRRLGCDVTAVKDGCEAVSVFAASHGARFDLILMDLMMPKMDGYAATAAIRSIEAEHGGRVPIVAMTASVQSEDHEKRRSVGMDGCLEKPIGKEQLEAAVHQPFHCQAPDRACGQPGAQGAFQGEAFCRRCDGDRKLMLDLVSTYLQMSEELLRRIRSRAAAFDFAELREASHKLCSATGNLNAENARRSVQRIEDLARRQIARGLPKAVEVMEGELRSLRARLLEFRNLLTAE